MPQLDFSTLPSQVFWLALSFLFLFLLVWRFAFPKISGVVIARENKISTDVSDAEVIRDEATTLKTKYEAAINDARRQGMELVNSSNREVEKQLIHSHKELVKQADQRITEAENVINKSRLEASSKLKSAADEIAASVAVKVLGKQVSLKEAKEILVKQKAAA